MSDRVWCPWVKQPCSVAEVCAVLWCGKGGPEAALKPQTWDEIWPLSKMPLDQLKALWDSFDGIETSDPNVSGEDVHMELNRRGEGHYCPV